MAGIFWNNVAKIGPDHNIVCMEKKWKFYIVLWRKSELAIMDLSKQKGQIALDHDYPR